jgi:hypothetical protein
MKMIRMRATFLLVITVSLSFLCYGVIRATEPTKTPHDAPYHSSGEEHEDTATIELTGSAHQATEKFELQAGLVVIDVKNEGKSNFVVELLDGHGEEVTNLFNEIDKFHGRRAFHIEKAGTYLLDVQATGPWAFHISQPRPEKGEHTPQTFEGHGMDVTPFVTLPAGLNVFEFKYEGEGRGIFTLLDHAGQAVEQVANQLETFHGSKPVKIEEEGIYLLNVYGKGNWTLTIKQ